MKKFLSSMLIFVFLMAFAGIAFAAGSTGYQGSMRNYFDTKKISWTNSSNSFYHDNDYVRAGSATGPSSEMFVEFSIGTDIGFDDNYIANGGFASRNSVDHDPGQFFNRLHHSSAIPGYTYCKGTIGCN